MACARVLFDTFAMKLSLLAWRSVVLLHIEALGLMVKLGHHLVLVGSVICNFQVAVSLTPRHKLVVMDGKVCEMSLALFLIGSGCVVAKVAFNCFILALIRSFHISIAWMFVWLWLLVAPK